MLITSYDLLRRDVDDYTANEQRFNVMALDEAQYIKNHTTKIAKAVVRPWPPTIVSLP